MSVPVIIPAAAARCAVQVAEVLKTPGAVALVPTETVYGLVARVGDAEAYSRIFELKQRSEAKVLGWFVSEWRELREYGVKLEGLPERLAEKYCPGAITIIAPTTEGSTLGFRSPDHPLLREILKLTGPLYQTSANLSGRPDPKDVRSALSELSGIPDIAVDGGRLADDAVGSTVVDAAGKTLKILRQGKLFVEL
ncbi:MAG: Sua5/YciO/YrdC/YwlC family protein [Lentisphaeria bacterium]|nr:Sua5/YciO/YrdC/YwlC family protein [Lentisphaeria bacterium]